MLDLEELSLSDLDRYYEFTNSFACYSDLNFVSLLSWSKKTLFSLKNSQLILYFEDYLEDGKWIVTGLCRAAQSDILLASLQNICSVDSSCIIDVLPESVITGSKDKNTTLPFSSNEDQDDYLYSPDRQLEMVGPEYSWHRRKISIFKRKSHEHNMGVTVKSELSENERENYRTLWIKWGDIKNAREPMAINRFLDASSRLPRQHYFSVTIDSKVEAYAFCEIVKCTPKTLLIHFFKSNKLFEGLANYLFFQIAQFAKDHGCEYVNFEQDLGQPGLRYYKQHLRPDLMLRKYSLTK